MKIRLCELDADRLGCPRDLTFDFEQVTGRDLMELEEQVGWNLATFENALGGVPATNAIGGPIFEMDGDKIKLDPMGKPIRVMTITTRTIVVIVWLCVRRANPEITWKNFDFQIAATEIEDAEEDPGKAPSSPKSTTTTKRRSARSSASARGTSGRS
jgi:hypothetical protein